MSRVSRTWLLLFGVLGLAASLGSSYVHYHLLRDPAYTSFCDINATVSCQTVYESRFGTVRGVPVALGGVIWFAMALLLTLAAPAGGRAENVSRSANIRAYLFILSTVALAVVLYLGYASFVLIKAVCLLCVLTYIAVIGIFLISGSSNDVAVTSLPRRALLDLRTLLKTPLALGILVLFLAGAATAVAFFPRETAPVNAAGAAPALPQAQASEFERWFETQPRVPLAVPAEGATVVIVKFNDYQCPACGQTYMNYKGILAKYAAERPGAVKMIAKDYPLEPECNANVPTVVHQAACEGAAAVRMATLRGKREAMEEWLYSHQPTLTPAIVREAARDIAQITDFDARYPTVLAGIRGDVDFARQIGIRVTPTFFIDGVRVEGGLRPEYFDAAIRLELKKADDAKAGSARPQ